jgi:hypothetical protein
MGWYKDAGVNVEFETGRGSAASAQKVAAGSSQLGLSDMAGVLLFRGKGDYRAGTTPYTTASAVANWVLPVAEITEEAPLIVEAIHGTKDGPKVLASGQVTPSDLRKAIFDIDLRNPTSNAKVGTLQLAASEPAASP